MPEEKDKNDGFDLPFLQNEELKIPEKKEENNNQLSFKLEKIPDELFESVKNLMNSDSDSNSISDLKQQLMKAAGFSSEDEIPDELKAIFSGADILSKMLSGIDTDSITAPDSDLTYTLESLEYIEKMGSIECIPDKDILKHFKAKHGDNYTNSLEGGLTAKVETRFSDDFIISDFYAEFLNEYENFLLFRLYPQTNKNAYPIFAAIIETAPNEFKWLIPSFYNTFKVDEETGEVTFYEPEKDAFFFDPDNKNGIESFLPLDLDTLLFGIRYSLAFKKDVLISPVRFGKIINQKVLKKFESPVRLLKIGKIISNESPEAILFKKDYDLNLNQTEFPFYIRFNQLFDPDNVNELKEVIFKEDLNNNGLMKNSELKSMLDENGQRILYIDVKWFS